jgi:hypothetical protein
MQKAIEFILENSKKDLNLPPSLDVSLAIYQYKVMMRMYEQKSNEKPLASLA